MGDGGQSGQRDSFPVMTSSGGGQDRPLLETPSPVIDFELCKTSVHERLKTFERWPMAAQASQNSCFVFFNYRGVE
jgi:hypothetical protein